MDDVQEQQCPTNEFFIGFMEVDLNVFESSLNTHITDCLEYMADIATPSQQHFD